MQYIKGTQKCINNIMIQQSKFLRDIAEATEKTCVGVSNSAKEGHAGNMAHANKRYQNQTTTLTRSITPELKEVSYKGVTGIVYTNMEYALYPSICMYQDHFQVFQESLNIFEILLGDTKSLRIFPFLH